MATALSREEQLRIWQANQYKKQEQKGTTPLTRTIPTSANKENDLVTAGGVAQKCVADRKANLTSNTQSSKKYLRAIDGNTMEESNPDIKRVGEREDVRALVEGQQLEKEGEDSPSSVVPQSPARLVAFKSRLQDFGRRASVRSTAPNSLIPGPPGNGTILEEEFSGSQDAFFSKFTVEEVAAREFEDENFVTDCDRAMESKLQSGRYDYKNREAEFWDLVRLLRRCLRQALLKKESIVKELGDLADVSSQSLEGAKLAIASSDAVRDAARADLAVASAALARTREESVRQVQNHKVELEQLKSLHETQVTKQEGLKHELSTKLEALSSKFETARSEAEGLQQQLEASREETANLMEKERDAQDDARDQRLATESAERQCQDLQSAFAAERKAMQDALRKSADEATFERASRVKASEQAAEQLQASKDAHLQEMHVMETCRLRLQTDLDKSRADSETALKDAQTSLVDLRAQLTSLEMQLGTEKRVVAEQESSLQCLKAKNEAKEAAAIRLGEELQAASTECNGEHRAS
ncbi:hypothetical protein CYMTET_23706 [Cymbomonas tetramitiformis]|uniref:Uncharacterized protein n=1 Tax=Cymbomonas tetramitiformis TaxID=36881 RepID=A0AAE0FXN9_9CHLO|nr:hypothetical protein CYMTET_23706 [Cymbomonas tetramitiformis]